MPPVTVAVMSSGVLPEELGTGDNDTNQASVRLSEPPSLSNSQTSSFVESTPSQTSNAPSSKDTSQLSLHDSHGEIIPLSASTHSTPSIRQARDPEDDARIIQRDIFPIGLWTRDPQAQSHLPKLSVQSTKIKGYDNDVGDTDIGYGQKRTAAGEVKSATGSLPTSPEATSRRSHSKTVSVNSNSSQIGELSAQLRTRLSYAMVKVQNGWQSRSIDEVESLASQQSSPTPNLPTASQPDHFRATIKFPTDKSNFAQSSKHSTIPLTGHRSNMHNGTSSLDHAYTRGSALTYSPHFVSPQDPYDPPWQDHSRPSTSGYSSTSTTYGSTLAPPIDILPPKLRRPNASHPQSPSIRTDNLPNLSMSSANSAISVIPSTPPSRPSSAIITPSQKATAMEQDAIETLLFMSSPGNTQHHTPSSQLPSSPLRNQFLAANKRISVTDDDMIRDTILVKRKSLLDSANLTSDKDIIKLLDQMPDGESSDDDDDDDMVSNARPEVPAYI